jgi:hypothetical protein
MIKLVSFLLPVFLLSLSKYGFAAQENEYNTNALHAVINNFSAAIVAKDKGKFLELFVEKKVSWVGILSENTYELLISKNPGFSKQSRAKFESPTKFITDIIKSPHVMRETFSNIVITHDSNVAAVTFDYEMYQNDFKKNWGQESWLLTKIDDEWKIHAVNFSLTLNPEVFKQQ